MAAQTLGVWLTIVFEFGFSLSFSRKITNALNDYREINTLVSQIISAKFLLMPIAGIFTYIASTAKIFDGQREIAWLAFAWAMAQGFTPIWYFQAREILGKFSVLDSFIRIIYIIFIFYIINFTHTVHIVLIAMIFCSLIVAFFSIMWMLSETGRISLSIRDGLIALRQGFPLAIFTLTTSLYTNASLIVLGFFVNPSSLVIYGNADRSIRAGLSLIGPINQIFLPKSSRAFGESYELGRKFTRKMIILYFFVSALMVCAGFILGRQIILLIFGERYLDSLKYFYVLLFLIPLTALNTVIVYHFLIPSNEDGVVNKIYISVSIISIALMVVLIPYIGLKGMLYAVTIPELLALISLSYIFIKKSHR